LIEIFGTKGSFHLDLHSKSPITIYPKKLKKNEDLKKLLSIKIHNNDFQHLLIDHFVDCILKKNQESPDFVDGKKAVEFILDAYSFKKRS
jgi:predicted dehydrogenase